MKLKRTDAQFIQNMFVLRDESSRRITFHFTSVLFTKTKQKWCQAIVNSKIYIADFFTMLSILHILSVNNLNTNANMTLSIVIYIYIYIYNVLEIIPTYLLKYSIHNIRTQLRGDEDQRYLLVNLVISTDFLDIFKIISFLSLVRLFLQLNLKAYIILYSCSNSKFLLNPINQALISEKPLESMVGSC